jgi:hypothetical protein
MSRAASSLLRRAKEVDATPFQINAAAILLAANGLPAALCYLDGCRTRFETATQVRAFLRGHGWKTEARTVKVKRSERGWIVRLPPPDGVGDGNRYAEKFGALQQILAGTNAEAWP